MGVFSTLGGYHEYTGDVQYSGGIPLVHREGYHEYTGGIPWWMWGDIMITAGVFSTLGDIVSTLGDTMMSVGGYREYTGGYSVHWDFHTNSVVFPVYSWYPLVYWTPPVYSWYPPLYCTPPGVLHRHYVGWKSHKTKSIQWIKMI